MIFGYLAGLRKLFQKTTKDRDVPFSPVVHTCIVVQIRAFVIQWLHIEFPVRRCVRLGKKDRTGHIISQYSYTSYILAINYLI